jgi:hypothetical protein
MFAAIPTPLSLTVTVAPSVWAATLTETPPYCVYLMALSSKLTNRRQAVISPVINLAGVRNVSAIPFVK